MNIVVSNTKKELGELAARHGAGLIRQALADKGHASIIVATGTSQFEMLHALTEEDLDWSRVTCFHLDEYLGIPITHPASFRKYLKERLTDKVRPKQFHYIDAGADPAAECVRLGKLIAASPVDVAFVGIGENGHLAFNDPPADFDTEEAYLVVVLDEACRNQQVNEGWFSTLAEVPTRAISMSIRQIMKSKSIVCTVPDQRKADAAAAVVNGPVTPMIPASVLQSHPDTKLFLDKESASRISQSATNR